MATESERTADGPDHLGRLTAFKPVIRMVSPSPKADVLTASAPIELDRNFRSPTGTLEGVR